MTVQFGIFDHLDQKPEPNARTLADRLEFIRAAEAGGYRAYHLAEHHGTPLGMGSSPSVFLAAVAQATTTMRLGPLVYLLPLYEPLRLIEEICLLDHLSAGRLEVGVGRGISPVEISFFGVDPEETASIAEEALSVIRLGLGQERLSFNGKYFNYDNVPMAMQPLQKPIPFWSASMSEPGLSMAARDGMHTAALGSPEMIKTSIELYKKASAESANAPQRAEFGVAEPLNGMYRIVVVADTDAEADRIAKPAYLDWFRKLIKLWREHGVDAPMLGPLDSYETARDIGMCVTGSPSRVIDELSGQIAQTGANYILTQSAFGDLTHADEMRSLELICTKVIGQV